MKCTLAELRSKEIINLKDGSRLGYVDDIEFDTEDASVRSFIVYGRTRLFGLLGKEDDIVITCGDIQIIGVDTVLVSVEPSKVTKRYSNEMKSLFK
ncbi:MAG: YlmC/YmxH family sporulation protein [Oscillospiraceae bacterium]|nr:YlmC/YmxH family sporulation protein [Oscillospiraceae bacterium]